MRIVFDTNVLIASIISHGACFEIFEHCVQNHQIFASQFIIDEFSKKLVTKFKYPIETVIEATNVIFKKVTIIELDISFKIDFSDKMDIPILSTAITSKSELLITGDKKMQALNTYQGVKIIRPADFWKNEH